MLEALYIVLAYFTAFFIVATIIKNNSIVDIGWGAGFVFVTWVTFFLSGEYNTTKLIVNIVITLWGLRLFYYILKRNLFEKEDFRYANWRESWGKWVIPRAFLQVFMLQGILQFLIASPAIYLNVNSVDFHILSLIGIVIWVIGYYFEVIGDKQLKDHIKKHVSYTASSLGEKLLQDWEVNKMDFIKVYPTDYKIALERLEKEALTKLTA